jgi:hypothetical protein
MVHLLGYNIDQIPNWNNLSAITNETLSFTKYDATVELIENAYVFNDLVVCQYWNKFSDSQCNIVCEDEV